MKFQYKIFIILFVVIGLFSCKSKKGIELNIQPTKSSTFKAFYKKAPASLLIMPPINEAINQDAKEFFYSVMASPLIEQGFYVFSPQLTMDFLRENSAYDSELFLDSDLLIFREQMGADAVVFTIIENWEKNQLLKTIKVTAKIIVKATGTGLTLYERKCQFTADFNVKTSSGGGLAGAVADITMMIVARAFFTATPEVEVASKCVNHLLKDMPKGKYHPNYLQDGEDIVGPYFIYAEWNLD